MRKYLDTLSALNDTVKLFDRKLWHVVVDYGTIIPDGGMLFTFKDGTAITGCSGEPLRGSM